MLASTRSFFLVLLLTLTAAASVFGQDGIYADFATSQGNFTCQLFYEKAPRTVANFISLATGEKAWLNQRTGEVSQKPYYDGIIFHRVIKDFVIQGGSPAGDGTDGPGYVFRDEFDSTLRHSKAGILSMANSGPNSNGSQFFVTLAATPHLDDVHSVFGEVASGMEVVNAIGAVPTTNDRPNTPVVINSVTVRRVGATAIAFDSKAQELPLVGGGGPSLAREGTSFFLQIPWAVRSDYWAYFSTDLINWQKQRLGFFATTPGSGRLDATPVATGQSKLFFRVPQIVYPGAIYAPQTFNGSQVTLTPSVSTADKYVLNFNSAGGGTVSRTFQNATTTGTITQYSWTPEPFRGQLICYFDTLGPILVNLNFTSGAGGKHSGTRYNQLNQPVASLTGTFTFTPPAPTAQSALVSTAATSTSTSPSRTSVTTTRKAVRAKRR